jgi:uncharacterized repeat protein (TIGR01451 family)
LATAYIAFAAASPARAEHLVDPSANPNLGQACGIDVVLLMDASTSINSTEEGQIEDAYDAFLAGLSGTGSNAAVVEFETTASVRIDYTAVTPTNITNVFNVYRDNAWNDTPPGYDPGGPPGTQWTNWQDAFEVAFSDLAAADLVVLLTDGDPTAYNEGGGGVNTNNDASNGGPEIDNAVTAANAIKTTDLAHILAVGIGTAPDEHNLVAVSGPDVFPSNVAEINPSTVSGLDVILSSFANVESALALFVEVACSDIEITKTGTLDLDVVGDPAVAEVGDEIDYEFYVENTGSTDLDPVVVTDPLTGLTAIDCSGQTTLAAGANMTCTATLTLTQDHIDAGVVDNTATATGTAPLATVVQDTSDESIGIEQIGELTTAKSAASLSIDADGSTDITAGDTVEFTVTATNTGNITLSNVLTPTGGTTPCASVAPDGTCTLVGTYVVTLADADTGYFDNTGCAVADEATEDCDTRRTTVEQDPALSVEKSDASLANGTDADASGDITAGDTVEFTVTATNTGNITLNNVVVSDAKLTPTGGTTPCGSVAPGGTCTLIGTYVVTLADADTGYFDNTGVADSDETDPDDDTVRTPVEQDGELTTEKSAASLANGTDADASGDITAGDTVEFTITATNTGNITLNNVVVTDAKLTPTGGTTPCGSVAPGGTCTLVGTYVVTQADADAGLFDNTGCANADEAIEDCDDERTTVEQDPEITITKGPDNEFVDQGQDFEWTIRVENTGNVTLFDVVVSDVLVPACDRDSGDIAGLAEMAPGEFYEWTCTVTDVQQPIFNVAVADADDPDQAPVQDSDTSDLFVIAAAAAIGDTVWLDEDGDGIEDPTEPGVPNADVDLYECLDLITDPECDDLFVLVGETTTNADGNYAFVGLEVGDYLVVIDLGTVDGDLTTPGEFIVALGSDETFENADFGVEEVLPVTGVDSDRLGWFSVVLLAVGGILILGSGLRRREN